MGTVQIDGEYLKRKKRTTVSYTHLDVYKRQAGGRSFTSNQPDRKKPKKPDGLSKTGYAYLWRLQNHYTCLLYTSKGVQRMNWKKNFVLKTFARSFLKTTIAWTYGIGKSSPHILKPVSYTHLWTAASPLL